MTELDAVEVTFLVVDTLDRLEIPYLIGGSLASAIYGISRSTLDTDIVVKMGTEHISLLVNELADEFYIEANMILDAFIHQTSFNIIHLQTMFKVDFFLLQDRPYDEMQFRRRILLQIATDPERVAFVSTPEDIILTKLEWYSMGGEISDRQWRDVLGVIKTQVGRLDLEYLKKWAVDLGVEKLLETAFQDTADDNE